MENMQRFEAPEKEVQYWVRITTQSCNDLAALDGFADTFHGRMLCFARCIRLQ
jgi:hypothetical protein